MKEQRKKAAECGKNKRGNEDLQCSAFISNIVKVSAPYSKILAGYGNLELKQCKYFLQEKRAVKRGPTIAS